MAKRYTSESRWKQIRKLRAEAKIVYAYVYDACDHSGVFQVDVDLIEFQTGISVSVDEIENDLKGIVVPFVYQGERFWWVKSFLNDQYNGELNPDNKVHCSVIKNLERYGVMVDKEIVIEQVVSESDTPCIPLGNPLDTPIIGDKNKDKDKEKKRERIVKERESEEKLVSDYTSCMDVYFDFIKQETGVPPKIDGAEGKALKSIVAYLLKLETVKNGEKKCSEVLGYIFENWRSVDPFHQKQLKLVQVNSNLVNIIASLKNGTNRTGVAGKKSELSEVASFIRMRREGGSS